MFIRFNLYLGGEIIEIYEIEKPFRKDGSFRNVIRKRMIEWLEGGFVVEMQQVDGWR